MLFDWLTWLPFIQSSRKVSSIHPFIHQKKKAEYDPSHRMQETGSSGCLSVRRFVRLFGRSKMHSIDQFVSTRVERVDKIELLLFFFLPRETPFRLEGVEKEVRKYMQRCPSIPSERLRRVENRVVNSRFLMSISSLRVSKRRREKSGN